MVKKANRKNGVKENKVKLDLFKASRGVFFAVYHFLLHFAASSHIVEAFHIIKSSFKPDLIQCTYHAKYAFL